LIVKRGGSGCGASPGGAASAAPLAFAFLVRGAAPNAVLPGVEGVVEAVVSGRAASAELALDELFAVGAFGGAFAVPPDEQQDVLS